MKNKLLLTLSTIALCASTSSLYAGGAGSSYDGDWYVGADLGVTDNNTDSSNFFATDRCAGLGIGCGSDDDDSAARIVAGYNFNKNFAVEFAYADLGDTANLNASDGQGDSGRILQDTTAFSVTAIGKKQLGHSKFSAFGKAGISYWDSEVSFDRTPDLAAIPDQNHSDSGVDPIVGLGMEYAVNPHWNIRAGWDRYFSVGDRGHALNVSTADLKTVDTDVDMFYVGATMSF